MKPVLQMLNRVMTGFLLVQASLKAGEADSGAPSSDRSVNAAARNSSFELSKAGRRYFSGSTLSSRKGRNSATVGWIGKASRSTW